MKGYNTSMTFTDSHAEMTPAEQHGIQLRVATDTLENGTADLNTRTQFLIRHAQAFSDSLAIRNDIQLELPANDVTPTVL